MKTLVLHLEDETTDFLKPIYKNIEDLTILNVEEKSSFMLSRLIADHDKLIFLGHGLPIGLIGYTVPFNSQMVVNAIRAKKDNVIYIWCNADQYVKRNKLSGFSTGMFISEFGEALYCGLSSFTREDIELSNNKFAEIVGEHINSPTDVLRERVYQEYNIEGSEVAEYNRRRLYYFDKGERIAGDPPPRQPKNIKRLF